MKIIKNEKPIVVLFGRTNVGKSTLFNRLCEKHQALTSNIEGTTRDSNIGQINWQKKEFYLIDTGGIMDLKFLVGKKHTTTDIEAKVQMQAKEYLKKADLILLVVDTRDGLLPQDQQMALTLKKILPNTKKVLLVANKADNQKLRKSVAEFYKLSLGEVIPVSATTGSGTGDLLDVITSKIKNKKSKREEIKKEDQINICLIGQPNVGKSSLINALLGEERVIVSSVAHTTREPQDISLQYKNKKIVFVDTAGISRKGKQQVRHKKKKETLEKQGIVMSLGALKKADIALLIIDINKPITRQDANIVMEIVEKRKSLIIIANKWDLIKEKDVKKFTNYIYGKFPFVQYAPIHFISALTKSKTNKILPLIIEVDKQRKIEISDSVLNKFLNKLIKMHAPAKGKGTKRPRIYELKQDRYNPPKFKMRIGPKDSLHPSYVRFVENRLREKFNIIATPLSIYIDKEKRIHGKSETHELAKKK